ncbi:MAG: SDR family oxidoreductase [Phycisphaerales bacterium]|jgi:NAD(P)-dependent dehydrogenase (short-subunit alcohol dehydrogenase family)|nr:SDR family oxidoreductase [Phycisphaerales bacterium]MBT7171774.1 SDR family oxidoreductase [Phycisphaerales bacterium]
MKHYIDGKVVVITGGSSGFGKAAAGMLLECGAKVVIAARRESILQEALGDLDGGENCIAISADATSSDDWNRLINETVSTFGRIDVLVNCHGHGGTIAPLDTQSDDDIRNTLDINLTGVLLGCREAIRAMKPNGRGHIINVSSACADHAWANWSVYTAAKAGLVTFTRCLHLEMAEWGGKATMFTPGAARTKFCENCGVDFEMPDEFPGSEEFARTLVHCIDVPANTVIEEVKVWGTAQLKEIGQF